MRERTFCRYIYTPMTAKRLGRRVTLIDRVRRWYAVRHTPRPDLMIVTGYFNPVYPRK